MKQLFLFQRKRKREVIILFLSIVIVWIGSFFSNIKRIEAAVSSGDLDKNVSSVSSISQYDFEKGRSSKDNQGIDKDYSLRFFSRKQVPVMTGNMSNYTGDDASHHGVGRAFFVKDNEKGKISATYKNLAEYTVYDGNRIKEVIPLDYKLIVTDWEAMEVDGGTSPYVTFGSDGGVGIRNMNWARVKSEFYRAGTSTKVSVKGLVTIKDVDDKQFVGIRREQVGKLYIDKVKTNLTYGTPTIGDSFLTFYNKTEGNAPDSEQYKNMFAFTLEGSSFDQVFGSTESPSGVDWFYVTDNKYVFTQIPSEPPTKSVSDEDEKKVTTNHVSSHMESWTYYVEQEVPREDVPQNYWNSFQFDDQVEDCLNIESVKVFNEDDSDVSSQFDISKNGQHVTAKAKNIKSSSFYDHVYSLRIQVRIKKEAESNFEAHGHYNENKTQLIFHNVGSTKIIAPDETREKNTNQVTTIVELPKTSQGAPGLDIEKSVKHFEWQVKDEVAYKVVVSHKNEAAVATDVVVTDTSMPNGLVMNPDSVKVSGVEHYDFKIVSGGWVLTTDTLKQSEQIVIEFTATPDATLNGTQVMNTARAKAYAVPEREDDAKIYINSPKLTIQKKTNKKEYKIGDLISYHLNITQENEGCFMRNIIIKDEIKTEGVDLKEGSIAVSNETGKDITKECDITVQGNTFFIETQKNLVKGDNPYDYKSETKLKVTYEAEILDDSLAGFDVENVAKVPATENTNGDVIRDDQDIPSGGDEDQANVWIKGAELSVEKDSDQTYYQYGDVGIYTVVAKQLREDYVAKQVVLTDRIKEDGCQIDLDSIQVLYDGEDITKQCEISGDERSYEVKTLQDLPFGSEIKLQYKVKFDANNITSVHNEVVVAADNAKEKKATHVVKLGSKKDINSKNKTTKNMKQTKHPKTGDPGQWALYLLVGFGSFLGLFLVLLRKIRYNYK